MKSFKQAVTAVAVASAVLMTGCAVPTQQSGDQTAGDPALAKLTNQISESTNEIVGGFKGVFTKFKEDWSKLDEEPEALVADSSYAAFLKMQPSFEPVQLGLESTDTLFASIAQYAAGGYTALVELDKATSEHMDGYKIFQTLEGLEAEGKQAEREAYINALDSQMIADFEAYVDSTEKIAQAQLAQRDAIMGMVVGVMEIVADKDGLVRQVKGASTMEKIHLAGQVAVAANQATLAKLYSNYFDKYEAVLINAQNDLGK